MPIPFVKNDPRINRKGRPKKGQTMTDILNWALDQKRKITDDKTGKEKSLLLRHMLAEKLISKAVDDGDVAAIKYIYDRLDGRPKETIEMSEKRNEIPDDPDECDRLIEQLEREISLTMTTRKTTALPAPSEKPGEPCDPPVGSRRYKASSGCGTV
jgi:hypothetical protein